jgi:hypothetical protein
MSHTMCLIRARIWHVALRFPAEHKSDPRTSFYLRNTAYITLENGEKQELAKRHDDTRQSTGKANNTPGLDPGITGDQTSLPD